MTRYALLLALTLLSGCERKPIWFGYWEIEEVTRGGVRQADAGLLEVMDDRGVAVFLRYTWVDDAFVPDPFPRARFGESDARKQRDLFDSFAEKDEVFSLHLSPFEATFTVESYDIERAELVAEEAVWPGRLSDLLPTELVLVR